MPTVSVVIPVYNGQRYLPDCIESVLGSTLEDVEIIVVDDGSDDESASIARGYPGVIVISQENRGCGGARNAGLRAATGKYVYFLDVDDYISPYLLERIYREASKKDLDGLLFNMQPVYESEELKRIFASWYDDPYRYIDYGTVFSGKALFTHLVRTNEYRVYVQRALWRRQMLLAHDCWFPERIIHEDECFTMKAMLSSERIACFEEDGVYRRYRSGSITVSSSRAASYYGYFVSYCEMARMAYELFADVPEVIEQMGKLHSVMLENKEEFEVAPPANAFPDSRYLTAFYAYLSYRRCAPKKPPVNESVMNRVARADSVYIYGAGYWGKRMHGMLADRSIAIERFIVSDGCDHAPACCGTRVISRSAFEEYVKDGNSVIVVSVKGEAETIAAELSASGFDTLCYFEFFADPAD